MVCSYIQRKVLKKQSYARAEHTTTKKGGWALIRPTSFFYPSEPRSPSSPDEPPPSCEVSAYTIMPNLNKTWVQKQGDFFVESPIILFAAIVRYLRIYKNGKYCAFHS